METRARARPQALQLLFGPQQGHIRPRERRCEAMAGACRVASTEDEMQRKSHVLRGARKGS